MIYYTLECPFSFWLVFGVLFTEQVSNDREQVMHQFFMWLTRLWWQVIGWITLACIFSYMWFLQLHLSLNRGHSWDTTDDFTSGFVHFSLFSTVLLDLVKSRPVHSLMLSSHLFLCLPCLSPSFTVPCKVVLARLDERETCPYLYSLSTCGWLNYNGLCLWWLAESWWFTTLVPRDWLSLSGHVFNGRWLAESQWLMSFVIDDWLNHSGHVFDDRWLI